MPVLTPLIYIRIVSVVASVTWHRQQHFFCLEAILRECRGAQPRETSDRTRQGKASA